MFAAPSPVQCSRVIGPDPQRSRRHVVSGRDRRVAAGYAVQAAALSRSGRSATAGQLGCVPGGCAGDRGQQRQSRRAGRSARVSARTCSTACRCSPSSCLRWPSGARRRAAGPPLPAQVSSRTNDRRHALAGSRVRLLEKHSWPGNVRELQHVIERASILAEGGRYPSRAPGLAGRRGRAADCRRQSLGVSRS